MLEMKTKYEAIECVVKSDNVTGYEKICIFNSVLPDRIKRDILMQAWGMLIMAESRYLEEIEENMKGA